MGAPGDRNERTNQPAPGCAVSKLLQTNRPVRQRQAI